jgi:guanylate kinase
VSNNPLLVVLSGPSGVGKDSIIRRLRELKSPFHYTVTATTRPPREGEIDGRDYFFLSPEQFETLRIQGGLLEHACVYGREYGVPRAPVVAALNQGHDVIMRTNVEGAASIRAKAPGAVLIFVNAPSQQVLESRLRGRQSDSEEDIEVRLATVRVELATIEQFDYVVVNDQHRLDDCIKDVEAIVRAEKCRVFRPPPGLA